MDNNQSKHIDRYTALKLDDKEFLDETDPSNIAIQRMKKCDIIMIILWIYCRITCILALISLYNKHDLFFYLLLTVSIIDAIISIIWSYGTSYQLINADYFHLQSNVVRIIIVIFCAILSITIGPIMMFVTFNKIEFIDDGKRLWLIVYGCFVSLTQTILMIVIVASQNNTYYYLLLISSLLSMVILPCYACSMPKILSIKQLIKRKLSTFDKYDRDLLFSGLLRAILSNINDISLPSEILEVIKQFHGEFGVKFNIDNQIAYRYYDNRWILATIKFYKHAMYKFSTMNHKYILYLTQTQKAMLRKYDNLEGILIEYKLYKKEGVRIKWLFIERGTICDCYGECSNDIHQIAEPNMNNKEMLNEYKNSIINEYFNSDDVIVGKGNGSGRINYYCGRFIGMNTCGHDGYCGPNNGPQCESCCRFTAMIES